jgi:ketosteroid isomerase-like protein
MSVEEDNKVLVRHIYELINRGGLAACYELCAPDYIEHMTDRDMDLEQSKEFEEKFFNDFSDISVTVDHMVAEGDKVAVLVTWRATQKDTGKKIEMTNANIFKFAHGKWAESWNVTDIRLAQQLGAIPSQ